MNINATDFELFRIPQQFAQDKAEIDARWKELQREAHPDKFAAQGASAQRIAMQWSVRINEAYQRLKTPIARAAYLCELNKAPINAERNTAMPSAFLMQQMELREALEDAKSTENLDEISDQAADLLRQMLLKTEQLIDQEKDFSAAAQSVRAMMFVEKFQADIERQYERLENVVANKASA